MGDEDEDYFQNDAERIDEESSVRMKKNVKIYFQISKRETSFPFPQCGSYFSIFLMSMWSW